MPESPQAVTGFRPSEHGFRFDNSWPAGAPFELAGITWARSFAGLCGGMCLLARQRWERGETIPPDTTAPTGGDLVARLWRAQVASLRFPTGPWRYWRLQQPGADNDRHASTLGKALPSVRRGVDAGRPVLLGLVRAVSGSPAVLTQHHVVLGWGYTLRSNDGSAVSGVDIAIYDPNHARADDVVLRISPSGEVEHSRGSSPVHALLPLD